MSSVLDYMFDNEWLQRQDIEYLKNSAQVMRRNAARDSRAMGDLEDQIAHLMLINEALMRMLEKKGVFGRDEFRSLLVEIDLEDGVHDGKLSKPPSTGGATRPVRDCTCKFCGTPNRDDNRFCVGCRRPLVRR